MKFEAEFECEVCGRRFTIDLGPQKLGELRTAQKIGDFIGGLAKVFAKNCLDCCPKEARRTQLEK